jgi:hypothetical protein
VLQALKRNWRILGITLVVFFIFRGCFGDELREPKNIAENKVEEHLEKMEDKGEIDDYDIGAIQVIEDSANIDLPSDDRQVTLHVLYSVTFPDGEEQSQFEPVILYKLNGDDNWVSSLD